jgi:hypothetical protein
MLLAPLIMLLSRLLNYNANKGPPDVEQVIAIVTIG